MSINQNDPISRGLTSVNDALRLLCDLLLAAPLEDDGGLRACRRQRGVETVRQIDSASAALRRVGMLMLNAGCAPVNTVELSVSSSFEPWADHEDVQARWVNFELALSFFRIASQRYAAILFPDDAPSDRYSPAMQRNQMMVAAELKVVASAIRQLYISAAMMEIGALSEAEKILPGSSKPTSALHTSGREP